MARFQDRVAIVTGAADGIGRVTAARLAGEGARVVIADVDEEAGSSAAQELSAAGSEALFIATDVSSTSSLEAMVNEVVARWAQIDVLVNNAAVALAGSVTGISEAKWQRVLNTNLSGAWRAMRFVLPHMVDRRRGAIVNVSSMQGHMGFLGWSAYAAAKGGLEALSRQAAVEYAEHGIRVNSVAPGTIMTPMNERIFREAEDPDALIKRWNELHALRRFGQPEEVAQAILFLASDEASFVTGETLRVEGGMAVYGG